MVVASADLDLSRLGESPALATDAQGRVVAWNEGAARLFGRPEPQALGRHCWELLRGRDVFGNRFCHESCAVRCMVRRGESVARFEIITASPALQGQALSVAILRVAGRHPGLETLVHILQPIDGSRVLADRAEPSLTPREKQILDWVAAGLQNKEIALEAGISLATVRNHVHNLLEKLGLHSKLEAISLAFRSGWVGRSSTGTEAQREPLVVPERKPA